MTKPPQPLLRFPQNSRSTEEAMTWAHPGFATTTYTAITAYCQWVQAVWLPASLDGLTAERASEMVMTLGLGGETSEVLEHAVQWQGVTSPAAGPLLKELGDALFYWACLGGEFRLGPSELFSQAHAVSAQGIPFESEPQVSLQVSGCAVALSVQAGKLMEAVKKHVRDGELPREDVRQLLLDYAYLWLTLCAQAGSTWPDVLQLNIDKVEGRATRGTLRGSGDDR